MSKITDYNKKIAELVLDSVKKFIESENRIIKGGGAYKGEMPLAVTSTVLEPALITPSSSLSGGPRPKRSHVMAPSPRRTTAKQPKSAAKEEVEKFDEGSGIKDRQRKQKADEGGKFNFVKSMKSVGKEIANTGKDVAKTATKKLINKGVDHLVDAGIKTLTNPAVDAGLEDAEEAALIAAAGMKKKRQPSRRNILIGELMKKHKCTLAEASRMIKQRGLK